MKDTSSATETRDDPGLGWDEPRGDPQGQKTPEETALEIGRLLEEHSGGDVVVMDMRSLAFWTDFFIIATVTSGTHLGGLERHVKEYARDNGLALRGSRKTDGDDWRLIDMGSVIIHLMSPRSRSFYELERLWSSASLIMGKPPAAYSSKSSSYSTSSS